MNAPERSRSLGDWTDANQRALVAEFARLKRLLARRGVEPAPVAGTAHEPDVVTSIASLTEAFGLSAFERDVLLLAAGVEMDSEIATLCAAAHGVEHKTWATFGLAMAVLPDPHWSALTPVRPLRRWQLLEVDEDAGLTQGRLRIDERVLHHLAGIGYLDRRLQTLADAGRRTPADGRLAARPGRRHRRRLAAGWLAIAGAALGHGCARPPRCGHGGGGAIAPAAPCHRRRGHSGQPRRDRGAGHDLAARGELAGRRSADRVRRCARPEPAAASSSASRAWCFLARPSRSRRRAPSCAIASTSRPAPTSGGSGSRPWVPTPQATVRCSIGRPPNSASAPTSLAAPPGRC